jgi:hypothetical protein
LLTESSLQLSIGGVGNSSEEDLNGILDILKIAISNGLFDLLPGKIRLKLRQLAAIDLSGVLALQWTMALLLTVLANLRRLVRAVRRTVTDLLTDTASACELASNSLIRAFGLVMSWNC